MKQGRRERAWSIVAVFSLLGGLAVVSYGCSADKTPQGDTMEFSSQSDPKNSELEFTVPEGWVEETPSSSMRHSQFRLPAAGPQAGDAEVAVFAGIGGSVEQNVQRWINQFKGEDPPKVDKRNVNGFPLTFVDISGTFSAGMMSGDTSPQPDSRMLAAVIETGATPWFVKLVGPESTVEKWEKSFTLFVESVK